MNNSILYNMHMSHTEYIIIQKSLTRRRVKIASQHGSFDIKFLMMYIRLIIIIIIITIIIAVIVSIISYP